MLGDNDYFDKGDAFQDELQGEEPRQRDDGTAADDRDAGSHKTAAIVLTVTLAVLIVATIVVWSSSRTLFEKTGSSNKADIAQTGNFSAADSMTVGRVTVKSLADMTRHDEQNALQAYADENFSDDQYYVIQDYGDYYLLIHADNLFVGMAGANQVTCYAVGIDGTVQKCGTVQTDGSTTLVETDDNVLAAYISHGDREFSEYQLNADSRELETILDTKGDEAEEAHDRAINNGLHVIDFGNVAFAEPYRNVVNNLTSEYGKDRIEYYPFVGWGKDQTLQDDILCYRGLCFLDLYDMNGDETPELIVSYEKGSEKGEYHYFTEIYGIKDGRAVKLWTGESGGNGSPAVYMAAFGQYEGEQAYLQYSGNGFNVITIDQQGKASGNDRYVTASDSKVDYIQQYLFNTTTATDKTCFDSTKTTTQETMYYLGMSYPAVEGPGSDDPDEIWPALILNLEFQHGNPVIEQSNARSVPNGAGQVYTGLCFLDLIDFDQDGKDELLTAYVERTSGDITDNSSDAGPQYSAKIGLYTIVDGKPELAWSGEPFVHDMPATARFYLVQYKGKEYLEIPPAFGEFRAITIEDGKAVKYGNDSAPASPKGLSENTTSYALNAYVTYPDSKDKSSSAASTDALKIDNDEFNVVAETTLKVLKKYGLEQTDDFHVDVIETPVDSTEEAEDQANISRGEQNLRNILKQRSGLKVLACYYADYDGDGREEAFAEMRFSSTEAKASGDAPISAQFWFVSSDGSVCKAITTSTKYYGTDHVASPHLIDTGSAKFITLSEYGGGSGALTHLYGVSGRSWYEVSEPYGMWIAQANAGTRDFEVTDDNYDAVKDASGLFTGHTYKNYYFYYDGAFHEYGATQISGDEFLLYSGASEILTDIIARHAAVQVDNILLRLNGLIHVNYSVPDSSTGETSYYTQTLQVSGNTVSAAGGEQQGTYLKAIFEDLAVY